MDLGILTSILSPHRFSECFGHLFSLHGSIALFMYVIIIQTNENYGLSGRRLRVGLRASHSTSVNKRRRSM